LTNPSKAFTFIPFHAKGIGVTGDTTAYKSNYLQWRFLAGHSAAVLLVTEVINCIPGDVITSAG